MCVCVCVVIPFILDVRLVDVPAGATQEEGHAGFFIHLPSEVLTLIFLVIRIQPILSLVDHEVEFCVLTNKSFSTCWAFIYFILFIFVRKNSSSCDCIGVQFHVPTLEGFEVYQLNHRGDRDGLLHHHL